MTSQDSLLPNRLGNAFNRRPCSLQLSCSNTVVLFSHGGGARYAKTAKRRVEAMGESKLVVTGVE